MEINIGCKHDTKQGFKNFLIRPIKREMRT